MKYLDPQEILIIHAKIIDATRGLHGVKDVGRLQSLTERVRNGFQEEESALFKKAAVYFKFIIQYHIFTDGNKRTGLAIAARFLFLNDHKLVVSNKKAEQFSLKIARNDIELGEIINWLEGNSKKRKININN